MGIHFSGAGGRADEVSLEIFGVGGQRTKRVSNFPGAVGGGRNEHPVFWGRCVAEEVSLEIFRVG